MSRQVFFKSAMAKFTVYFKDKAVQSNIFDTGVVRIGRDETNDLVIDNLAVAPAHAVVIIKDNSCIIKQLNDDFPITINNETNKESLLQNNDKILIGKHAIVYATNEPYISAENNNIANKDLESFNDKLEEIITIPDANIQILDGQHIGRVLPIKNKTTRFGHSDSGIVIITKGKEGYFISSLEGDANNITINQTPLADKSINLNNNDIIVIDNISMQFFLEK